MNQPKTIDPVEWARYNQAQQHRETRERVLGSLKPTTLTGSRAGGKSLWAREQIELSQAAPEPEIEAFAVTVEEMPGPVLDLTLAVHRAASELEGSSERGDRIALQLLTALARFERSRHALSEGL